MSEGQADGCHGAAVTQGAANIRYAASTVNTFLIIILERDVSENGAVVRKESSVGPLRIHNLIV